jgi:uncharacterized protein
MRAYAHGYGCEENEARSLELARKSSGKGSRYGQCVLGELYLLGGEGVAEDEAEALALLRLAAAQNLDWAQVLFASCLSKDFGGTLRWYQLAAAQGHPLALRNVGNCYERGHGVPKNMAEAIRWYRRAQAAEYGMAAADLQRLGAK